MIFKTKRPHMWRKHFAIFPVTIYQFPDVFLVWLQFVERRDAGPGSNQMWEYRQIVKPDVSSVTEKKP